MDFLPQLSRKQNWGYIAVDDKYLESDHECLIKSLNKAYGIHGRIRAVSEKMSHTYSHIKLKYKAVLIEHVQGEVKLDKHTNARWQKISYKHKPSLHKAHQKVLDWIQNLEIKTKGNISS